MLKGGWMMIYVVRHGQTNVNRDGRIQGRNGGLPLNENGFRQAEELRASLSSITFDFVFSSPQERAVQTAEIATGMRATIDSRLDVYDLGEADGMLKSEVKLQGGIPDPHVYKGVENPRRYAARVFKFMNELLEDESLQEKNILIAGHRCTTGCIGAYYNGLPDDWNILRFSSGNGEYKVYPFLPNKKVHI